MVIAIVVMVLGLVGLLDSVYYTLIHYGYMSLGSPLVPIICDKQAGACRTVATSSWASLLGMPNSIFGIGYYLLAMLAAGVRMKAGEWPYHNALKVISIAAAFFSIYLAWALMFRVRALCPLCITAQAINVILAAVFLTTAK